MGTRRNARCRARSLLSRLSLPKAKRENLVWWLALSLLVVSFLLIGVTHLEGFRWDFDEGVYMEQALLSLRGYPLYESVFCNQPPLWVQSLVLAFRMLTPSIHASRLVTLLYSILGLVGLALISRETKDWPASLLSVSLVASAPAFFKYSRVCIGDVPSLSLGTLALASSFYYRRFGHKIWLIGSGLLMGLSLMVKLLAFPILLPLGFSILWPYGVNSSSQRYADARRDLAFFGFSLLLVVILCLMPYDAEALYAQVFAFRWKAKELFPLYMISNLREIGLFIWAHKWLPGLALLAILGSKRSRFHTATIVVWLVSTLLVLSSHSPLWEHLLVIILFPLGVLAGVGSSEAVALVRGFKDGRVRGDSNAIVRAGLSLAALSLLFVDIPYVISENYSHLVARQSEVGFHTARYVENVTFPDDFIITDEPLVAFQARRMVPPSLVDTSFTRMESGYLTVEDVIENTQRYRPPAIILWSHGRFRKCVPEYLLWLRANRDYYEVTSSGARRQVFIRVRPSNTVNVPLTDEIALLGYDYRFSKASLKVIIYWEALKPPEEEYLFHLKLLDEEGKEVAWQKGPPAEGLLPTKVWRRGAVLRDGREFALPPDAPSSSYRLEVEAIESASGRIVAKVRLGGWIR